MATYFDTSKQEHKNRLHPDVRDSGELDTVAKRAERDVLGKLNSARRVKNERSNTAVASDEDIFDTTATSGVFAIGYPSDPSDPEAPTGQELERLLDCIADVISHRLLYRDEDYTATSQSRGARSVSRDGGFNRRYPQGWRRPLDPHIEDTYGT